DAHYLSNPILAPFVEAGVLRLRSYESEDVTRMLRTTEADTATPLRWSLHVSLAQLELVYRRNSRFVASSLLLPSEIERLLRMGIDQMTIEKASPLETAD